MQQTFSDLITGRRQTDSSVVAYLERLVSQYPYCQAGQMLYAKALQQSAVAAFDQQMHRAMAAAPDRRHFRFMLYGQTEPDRVDQQEHDPEELIYQGSAAEAEGYNEDTRYGKRSEPGAGTASAGKAEQKNRQQAIIDRFLRKNPRIEARKDEIPDGEMAPESLEDHPELISETLAEIHTRQGKTDRAIEIYKKLSLKFPEKSSYFAKKIESIERKTN